jgi:hypothetical protein
VLAADEEREGATSPKALARRVLSLLSKPSDAGLADADVRALERRA